MGKYIWVVIESGSTVFFQFLSLIVLSRLLQPKDYGIFGMMAIFMAVSSILADSGLGGALIKKRTPTIIDYGTFFSFNFLTSLACYLLLFGFSDLIASFYDTPELANCLKIYGLYLIIASLGIVQYVRLNKELRFKAMAITSLLANVVGLAIAIIMAYNGYGYWGLIGQHLTYIIVRVILQTSYTRYYPYIAFSKTSFRELFSFGGSIMLSGILNVVYSNIASSIIPKVGTIRQNGLYVQAARIQQVPLNILSAISDKVLFPVLCKKPEKAIISLSRKYIRRILLLAAVLLCFCVIFSHPLVKLILGEKWQEMADYLQILFFASYGLCHQYIGRTLFKSIGKTKKILLLDFYKSIFGLLILSFAAIFGINALLWGMVCISFAISIVYIYLLRCIKYIVREQLYDILPSAIIVFICFFIFICLS